MSSILKAWSKRAMARILAVDPRLGQPPGALKICPSVLKYHPESRRRPFGDEFHFRSVGDLRGSSCGGQVLIYDIALKLFGDLFDQNPGYLRVKRMKSRLYRVIREAANELDIQRFYFSKSGRRYLMFNAGEAELVYMWLYRNREDYIESLRANGWAYIAPKARPAQWEFVDGTWELREVQRRQIAGEQTVLPGFPRPESNPSM